MDYQQDLQRAVKMSNIRMLKIARKTSATDVVEPKIDTMWQKPGQGKKYTIGSQESGIALKTNIKSMPLANHLIFKQKSI